VQVNRVSPVSLVTLGLQVTPVFRVRRALQALQALQASRVFLVFLVILGNLVFLVTPVILVPQGNRVIREYRRVLAYPLTPLHILMVDSRFEGLASSRSSG
jgi:hypothetical protein